LNQIEGFEMTSNIQKPGLYLHIPFCLQKCAYCDFYSITDLSLVHEWILALEREITLYKDQWDAFDTLYIGGGTPSLLSETEIIRLFELLQKHFYFIEDTEITFETNPDDLSREKLILLKDLGITRISLGVQSFSDRELDFLGRRHTARQAGSALSWIRELGYRNLSIDLMYGLPDQEMSSWISTMKRALNFNPEHLSCYQITIHDGTKMGQLRAEGKLKALNEETERTFFFTTSEFLQQKGYIHYEISNFALTESNLSQHNCKYWQHIPYLGLGPGAHSFTGQERWWNIKSVKTYCQKLNNGLPPIEDKERLTEKQKKLEYLFLGLRTKAGIDLSLLENQEKTNRIIQELVNSNLMRVENCRLIPTLKGFAVADSLPLLFE
jgi:oxygen-independent coproporphyrinogen-3 oxidase